MLIRRSTSLPIGLDIGLYGARMVQLRIENDAPVVVAAARVVWPEELRSQFVAERTIRPSLIAPLLSRMASQGEFSGRGVVLSLPREQTAVKNLRLPVMPIDDLVQAAQIEAMAMFGVTEHEARVEVIPAGEVRHGSETKNEVIAVCVRNSDVDRLCEEWHGAGFRPKALDFEPAALYRTVERFVRRRDDESEVNVLVEVGLRRTTVLMGRGRELSFHKSIDIGGAMLTHAVSRKLGINTADAITLRQRLSDTFEQVGLVGNDPVRQTVTDSVRPIVEEIARELALCLRYFSVNFRGQRPSRVRLIGGESADASFVKLLGNAMPVPVEASSPIANADLSLMKAADRNSAMGEWTHAFGLALKFTKGGFPDRLGVGRTARAASERVSEVDSTVRAVAAPAPAESIAPAASQPAPQAGEVRAAPAVIEIDAPVDVVPGEVVRA